MRNHTPPRWTLLLLVAGSVLAPRVARADTDGDGWAATDSPPDCDDNNANVHPAAEEDGTDDTDEDCDGAYLVERSYVASMNSMFSTDFTLGAAAALTMAGNDDLLRLVRGAGATASMTYDLTFNDGLFTVMLNVKAWGGVTPCTVTVTSSNMAASSKDFIGPGIKVLQWSYDRASDIGLQPGDTVSDLAIDCSAGYGTVDLDWITITDGEYGQAPMNDVVAISTGMGLPGMGRQSVVRASLDASGDPGTTTFVGSDVGGLGWSDDGYTWYTANGTATQWLESGEMGVWEVWNADASPDTVIVLTGDKDTGDGGGLYYTDALGNFTQAWTDAGGGLGASKHMDDCGLGYTPVGSGQLIVNEPSDTTGTIFLVASSDPDTTGLYTWVTGSTPAAQTFNASLPSGVPSALALDSSGEYLLVGFRPLLGASEEGALYVCPADFDAASVADCELVSSSADPVWAGDVRDIEADPNTPGLFYVADGGRQVNGTTCDTGESTVFAVEVVGDFATSSVVPYIYDTDDDTADYIPDWANDTTESDDYYYEKYNSLTFNSSTGAYYHDACVDKNGHHGSTYGELVAPRGTGEEGHELSSIAIDPAGSWLFAFYPLSDLAPQYGCVRTFRAEVGDVADGSTPWKPYQGWTLDDVNYYVGATHPEARRAAVDVTGASAEYDAFMVEEPLLEDWAGAGTHDATFAADGDGNFDLLLGGNFLWRALAEDTAASIYGWNTAQPASMSSTVLDSTEWELAWDGASQVFQDSIVNSIAACPGCDQSTGAVVDLVIAAGVSDYKMAVMHGRNGPQREAADRPCEVHMLDSSGKDVSVWSDGAGGGQAWMSLINQNDTDDSTWDRGMLFLPDIMTDEWCWDSYQVGTSTYGITSSNFINDWWATPTSLGADTTYELVCQDSDIEARTAATGGEYWESCNPDPQYYTGMDNSDVGQVVGVNALADGEALLIAAPGMPDPGTGTTAGGEGLWLASFSATTGISYTEVPFSANAFGVGVCTESEFFAWESQVTLAFDPSSDASGTARGYLSSIHSDCGVVEVEFDAADPTDSTTTTWTEVDLSLCSLDTPLARGVAINRDGTWLFAYGGPDTSAGSGSADGGVCAVDLTGTYATQQVVDGDAVDIQIETFLAHPHIDDMFYFGGHAATGTVDAAGVYALQRRYRPATADWNWAWRRLNGNDLEHKAVLDLAWGTGSGGPGTILRDLYVATSGGGAWDLRLSSQ